MLIKFSIKQLGSCILFLFFPHPPIHINVFQNQRDALSVLIYGFELSTTCSILLRVDNTLDNYA